ncbi:MAG: DUF2232 domain-containing protein [Alphaproteobacteria bacterium]|nr:DUF2232 domain-containing protein [Alphaproteobacteria bacterium]
MIKNNPETKPILIAALLSAGTFFAVLMLGLGSFFLFIPSLPLFYVGLSLSTRTVFLAALAAAALVGMFGHIGVALTFLLMIGLPTCYLAHCSLLFKRREDGKEEWFPLGLSLLNLTISAAGFLAIITLFFAFQPTTLPSLLASFIRTTLEPLKAEFGSEIEGRLLASKGQNIRPDMAIAPFAIPSWMLYLLGICALASLIGGESSQFLGKTLLIVLALPYFFLGLALLHQISEKWPNRKFFLFIVYLLVILLFWPALLVSGYGLWNQVKTLKTHHG